jgi:hypothetical protein
MMSDTISADGETILRSGTLAGAGLSRQKTNDVLRGVIAMRRLRDTRAEDTIGGIIEMTTTADAAPNTRKTDRDGGHPRALDRARVHNKRHATENPRLGDGRQTETIDPMVAAATTARSNHHGTMWTEKPNERVSWPPCSRLHRSWTWIE